MKETVIECVRAAGKLLLGRQGTISKVHEKDGNISNIVTEADTASEKCIIEIIRKKYPSHNIISEEAGFLKGDSEYTWIIDPLDGTANFAAGLPWFGVLVAVMRGETVMIGAMYIPSTDTLYFSEKGNGVQRNGISVHVSKETNLKNILCSYGMDCSNDESKTAREVLLMRRLVENVRNVRVTNCLVDLGFAVDGRFGGCINNSTKIWDIAPAILMFEEAGGMITDMNGSKIEFDLDENIMKREFPILGSSKILHPKILKLIEKSASAE